MAQFRQPDHAKGDTNTLGGYIAVHDRPAAFEGSDGFSYSAEIIVDRTTETASPYAAYLLFVRWARIGAQSPEGHLETDYLATGSAEDEVRAEVGALKLASVKSALDELIAAQRGASPQRRWWDAMRDEGGEDAE
jgi:hypothetical protein